MLSSEPCAEDIHCAGVPKSGAFFPGVRGFDYAVADDERRESPGIGGRTCGQRAERVSIAPRGDAVASGDLGDDRRRYCLAIIFQCGTKYSSAEQPH